MSGCVATLAMIAAGCSSRSNEYDSASGRDTVYIVDTIIRGVPDTQQAAPAPMNDLARMGLKGPVKKVEEEYYEQFYVTKFDRAGNLISFEANVEACSQIVFFANGKPVKGLENDCDGEVPDQPISASELAEYKKMVAKDAFMKEAGMYRDDYGNWVGGTGPTEPESNNGRRKITYY